MVRVGAVPVPLRASTCSALIASLTIVRSPVRAPAAVGLKVTVTVQDALGARLAAQVFVAEKSPAAITLRMLRGALPELVIVTDCPGLVTPTSNEPKPAMPPDNVT